MKLDLLEEQIEDMPIVINWDLRQQMGFIFELPTRDVQAVLPVGLQPFEARPGVSMMFLGFNDYHPGNVIYGEKRPAFQEITRFFLVHPDLAIDMPMPRFAFFVHHIGANDPAFIKQEIELLHLPSYDSASLKVETTEARLEARARDVHGPIQDLINTNKRVVFREEQFYGQYYSVQDGKLYFGVWYWSGEALIHQKAGKAGGIYDHPFLTNVPGEIGHSLDRRPYMQIVGRCGSPTTQIFYQPRFVREINESRAK